MRSNSVSVWSKSASNFSGVRQRRPDIFLCHRADEFARGLRDVGRIVGAAVSSLDAFEIIQDSHPLFGLPFSGQRTEMQSHMQFLDVRHAGCVQMLDRPLLHPGNFQVHQQTDQLAVHRGVARGELGGQLFPQRFHLGKWHLAAQHRDLHHAQQIHEIAVRDEHPHRGGSLVQDQFGVLPRGIGHHQRQPALNQQSVIVRGQQPASPRIRRAGFEQPARRPGFDGIIGLQQRNQRVERRILAGSQQRLAGPAADPPIAVGQQLNQRRFRFLARVDSHQLGGFAANPLVLVLRNLDQQFGRRRGAVQLQQIQRAQTVLPGIGGTDCNAGHQTVPVGADRGLQGGDLLAAPGRFHLRLPNHGVQTLPQVGRGSRRRAFPFDAIQSAHRAAPARHEIEAAVGSNFQVADTARIAFDEDGQARCVA